MPVPDERRTYTPRQFALRLVLGAAAVVCAAAAGWMHLRAEDLTTTLLFVAGTSFAFAALVRGWGALGGVLIGLGVPLARLYAALAGISPDAVAAHATRGYYPMAAALGGIVVGLAARTGAEQARQRRRRR
ncbi:MAG: hypothetical protein KGL38_05110 [Gemmatimonadota bacterium]|nr:hypothetical protein [Gemmatimonadota bacterium]MDE3127362.1 hypothetical protein [Gemmatimonadota bacterium]MDE3216632.1 hypothetical protein [Gemmatimonadota bacterium]